MQPKPSIYHSSEVINCSAKHHYLHFVVQALMPYQTYFYKYLGSAGKTFCTRYTDHMRNIGGDTRFSHHNLDTGHGYGIIENTMTLLKNSFRKRTYMTST